MKTMATIAVASLLGFGLASGAVAQQTQPREPQTQRDTTREPRAVFQRPANTVESKTLIGMRVKSSQGKDLGEIDQVLVDPQTGRVTHAVIGAGGLMGVGESHVVVPWSAVQVAPDRDNRDKWVAQVEQSTLERAPKYERRASLDRAPSSSPRTEPGTTGTSTEPKKK